MPFTPHDTPASRDIFIGHAHMLARAVLDVSHYLVDEDKLNAEVERLHSARTTVCSEPVALKRDLSSDVPEETGVFLDVHAMISDDVLLSQVPETLTRQRRYNAERTLTTQPEELIRQFGGTKDEYLRECRADIKQVIECILKVLAGTSALTPAPVAVDCSLDAGMIVVAYDTVPADVLQFRGQTFAGFATDLDGRISHTTIVACSFDIPAAVGVYNASALIRQDDIVIIGGDNGIATIDPSMSTLEEYRHHRSEGELQERHLERLCHMPTVTLNGTQIELWANIGILEDAATIIKADTMGMSLFRSEFLSTNRRGALSNKEEQFRVYCTAAEPMMGLSVTIRTTDIGANRPLDIRDSVFETVSNPALGLRVIYWLLPELAMFLIQLRALLRASTFESIEILVPMLAHVHEISQTLELLARAKASPDTGGLTYDPSIKVGVMIEILVVTLILPVFLRRMNSLLIGMDDLIQYAFAIGCADNTIMYPYDLLHPAVLQLITCTIREAHRAGKSASACGEVAGDVSMMRLLLGMGLTEFSTHLSQLLSAKQQILRLDCLRLMHETGRLLHAYELAEIEEASGAPAWA